MRIAFIYPATDFDLKYHKEAMPIGLLYLAAVAEQYGAQVDIYDRRHGEVIPPPQRVNDYDLIGFTAMSMQIPTALRLARRIRRSGYKGPTIIGGPHASVATDHLKNQPFFNGIFLGEAEDTFLEYLRYLEGKPHSLGRIWLRQSGGTDWRFHPSDRFIEDLDSIPLPAREKYADLIRHIRGINLTSTRGCPFKCNYCQPTKEILFGKKVRRRSVGNILAEIHDAIDRFGIGGFSIDDDTFTFHKKTVLDFCEQVRELKLTWSCQSRSDIDRETLAAMRDSGLTMLYVGAESGSQRMLDLMHKRNTVEKNVEFMRLCNELGIQTWCNMMVGYPGETEEDLKKSLEFVRQTQPTRTNVSQVTPFPGTHLWQERRDDVIERDWDELARHVHRPKFRSLAKQQSLFQYYLVMMSKDWDLLLNADLLQLSKAEDSLCRRFPQLLRFYIRKAQAYAKKLHSALNTARKGGIEDAVQQLERLSRRYPKRTDPLGHLGWLYMTLNRPADAARAYERLLRLEPQNSEAKQLLAQAKAHFAT